MRRTHTMERARRGRSRSCCRSSRHAHCPPPIASNRGPTDRSPTPGTAGREGLTSSHHPLDFHNRPERPQGGVHFGCEGCHGTMIPPPRRVPADREYGRMRAPDGRTALHSITSETAPRGGAHGIARRRRNMNTLADDDSDPGHEQSKFRLGRNTLNQGVRARYVWFWGTRSLFLAGRLPVVTPVLFRSPDRIWRPWRALKSMDFGERGPETDYENSCVDHSDLPRNIRYRDCTRHRLRCDQQLWEASEQRDAIAGWPTANLAPSATWIDHIHHFP